MSFSRLITVKAGNSQQRQAARLRCRQKWVRGYNEGEINVKIKTCAQCMHKTTILAIAGSQQHARLRSAPVHMVQIL